MRYSARRYRYSLFLSLFPSLHLSLSLSLVSPLPFPRSSCNPLGGRSATSSFSSLLFIPLSHITSVLCLTLSPSFSSPHRFRLAIREISRRDDNRRRWQDTRAADEICRMWRKLTFFIFLFYSGEWQPLVGVLRERILRGGRHAHPSLLLRGWTETIL